MREPDYRLTHVLPPLVLVIVFWAGRLRALALRAQTAFAAWHCRADDLVGTLAVGKKADLVILGDDPFQVSSDDIADIAIFSTWVNGRQVYPATPDKSAL